MMVGMAAAAISVRGLGRTFPTPSGTLTVLDGLDLEVAAGEHVAVVGPSGSGKSTLLAVLGGLEPPQSGEVEVGGHDLRAVGGQTSWPAFRRDTVGFVFQHFGLLDALTAEENIELAGTLAGTSTRERRARARRLLDAVGLAGRRDHRPPQLSGGERQRVAMARALVNRARRSCWPTSRRGTWTRRPARRRSWVSSWPGAAGASEACTRWSW